MLDVSSYLKTLSDSELIKQTKECFDNLKVISETNPNSEEHDSCFAAMHYFANEMQSRNLSCN